MDREAGYVGTQPSFRTSIKGVWKLNHFYQRKRLDLWISPPFDPYASSVVLLLNGNGINNSPEIIDSSPTSKTITRLGNTSISTTQSKYGGSSIYFDGNGDFLRLNNEPDFTDISNNSSIDYTIELWVYCTSSAGNRSFFDTRLGGSGGFELRMNSTTLVITFYYTGSTLITSTNAITLNQWNHVALTKTSSVFKLWINGVGDTSDTFGTRTFATTPQIGGNSNATNHFIGWIDSFRITKGVARYTANFNPETDTYLAY